ncbi:hypothetical protein KC19_2G029900 [Ceratodon purpureus]|nr:hypothetical protein KC19_2G029900 [Ceratodon purpureus]
MNPETERRLAAMIMEEANMMRQRAEKDGVGAYLAKPVVKARPNRQFLTAMVRGVQHANRIVDMEEMWRQRELENKATRDKYSRRSRNEHSGEGSAERDRYAERRNANEGASRSSSSDQDEDGLRDEDIEKFLHSKVKRGRGAVGSRMDEPGPYRARQEGPAADSRLKEDWEERIPRPVAGPSLPPERVAEVAPDSRRESKKHKKEKSSRVNSSDSDEGDRKRRRESKERKRKKEKRKSKDSEKHSKKKRKSRH